MRAAHITRRRRGFFFHRPPPSWDNHPPPPAPFMSSTLFPNLVRGEAFVHNNKKYKLLARDGREQKTKTGLIKAINEETKVTAYLGFFSVLEAESNAEHIRQSHKTLNELTNTGERKRVLAEFLSEDCAHLVLSFLHKDRLARLTNICRKHLLHLFSCETLASKLDHDIGYLKSLRESLSSAGSAKQLIDLNGWVSKTFFSFKTHDKEIIDKVINIIIETDHIVLPAQLVRFFCPITCKITSRYILNVLITEFKNGENSRIQEGQYGGNPEDFGAWFLSYFLSTDVS